MHLVALFMPWVYIIEAISSLFYTQQNNDYEENYGLDEDTILRVAIFDDKAYWVYENIFYESELVDGDPDLDTAKPIDAITMSDKEISQMLLILDTLKED